MSVYTSGLRFLHLKTGEPYPNCLTRTLRGSGETVEGKGCCELQGAIQGGGRFILLLLKRQPGPAVCRLGHRGSCSKAPSQRGLIETRAPAPAQAGPGWEAQGRALSFLTEKLLTGPPLWPLGWGFVFGDQEAKNPVPGSTSSSVPTKSYQPDVVACHEHGLWT